MYSGGSRPSAKEGVRLTMKVEFCEDNSGTSKKMRYFRKNKVGGPGRGPGPRVPSPGSATAVYATLIQDKIELKYCVMFYSRLAGKEVSLRILL